MGKTLKVNIHYSKDDIKIKEYWNWPWTDMTVTSIRPVQKIVHRKFSRYEKSYYLVKFVRDNEIPGAADSFKIYSYHKEYKMLDDIYQRAGRMSLLEDVLNG